MSYEGQTLGAQFNEDVEDDSRRTFSYTTQSLRKTLRFFYLIYPPNLSS